jgi:preprotein translocase subunit Sss1
MMYWRAMKIKILVGLVVVGLIGFIILIIVQKVKGK